LTKSYNFAIVQVNTDVARPDIFSAQRLSKENKKTANFSLFFKIFVSSVTPLLQSLHPLLLWQKIVFKINFITFHINYAQSSRVCNYASQEAASGLTAGS